MAPGPRRASSERTGAGVTNGRVYRKAEDPNDILVRHDITDVAKARAWTEGAGFASGDGEGRGGK